MQKPNLHKIFATWTVISILLLAVVTRATAQSNSDSSTKRQTVTVSEDFLKAVDKALVELDGLRKIKKFSDEQAVEYQDKINQLQLAFNIQERQLTMSEHATDAAIKAFTVDRAALDKAKEVIADYTTELSRVRKQRDRARSWLWKVGVMGVVVGLIAGVFVSK